MFLKVLKVLLGGLKDLSPEIFICLKGQNKIKGPRLGHCFWDDLPYFSLKMYVNISHLKLSFWWDIRDHNIRYQSFTIPATWVKELPWIAGFSTVFSP